MSAIKRHIEDRCEEIAKETGLNWDEVMDVFNYVNNTLPYKVHFNDEEFMNETIWETVELECKKLAWSKREANVIKTGYIPVEYNHYKELVRKAVMFDKMYDGIVGPQLYFNLDDDPSNFENFMSGKTEQLVLEFDSDVDLERYFQTDTKGKTVDSKKEG